MDHPKLAVVVTSNICFIAEFLKGDMFFFSSNCEYDDSRCRWNLPLQLA